MSDRLFKRFTAIFALFIMFPVISMADDDESEYFTARFAAEVDYKLFRGFHIFASEELRLGGSNIMDRSQTELGLSYKFNSHLKAGLSYKAIAVYKCDVTEVEDNMELVKYWYDWRHRVSGFLMASFKAGQWRFSLKETIQGTHKVRELNNFQQPQTAWVLKSRLKISYKFRTLPIEPYVGFEPRLFLNDANWGDVAMTSKFEECDFLGHNDVYFNRYRGEIGVEWKLNSKHSIDFYGLCDYYQDKEIDARKEGSSKGISLKTPIVWNKGINMSVGLGYKFSF